MVLFLKMIIYVDMGNIIIIDHGEGWLSMYSNVQLTKYKVGQYIKKGDIIGTIQGKKFFFSISYKGSPLDPISIIQRKQRIYTDS